MQRSKISLGVGILGILMVSLLTYGEILHYYFTDVDIFSLINDGRFASSREFFDTFASELMSGRMINAVYYRPLTSLVLGVLYKIFGLHAVGYHFADLMLFMGACIAIFILARQLWGERRGSVIGFLAALIFILHPVQVDTVPANARIGDMLMVFFGLWSLVALARYFLTDESRVNSRGFYWLSVLLGLLAVCSKEPGVIVPGVVAIFLFLFDRQPSLFKRAVHSMVLLVPYAITTLTYFYFRGLVIGGVGGYVTQNGEFDSSIFSTFRIKVSLLGHFFGLLTPSLTDDFDHWAFFLFNRTALLITLGAIGLAFAVRALWPYCLNLLRHPRGDDQGLEDQRSIVFLIGFFALHTALLFKTFFSFRYLYFALAPFSLVVAFFAYRFGERGFLFVSPQRWPRWMLVKVAVAFGFAVLVFAQSPLWDKALLRRWDEGASVTRSIVTGLAKATDRDPSRPLYLLNIPYAITYGRVSPIFWEIPFNQLLLEHALVDYLDMVEDQTRRERSPILVLSYSFLTDHPEKAKLKSRFLDDHTVEVEATSAAVPARFPWTEIPGRNDRSHLFTLEGGRIPFEVEPKVGWGNKMKIHLTDLALRDPKPLFYAFDGQGLVPEENINISAK